MWLDSTIYSTIQQFIQHFIQQFKKLCILKRKKNILNTVPHMGLEPTMPKSRVHGREWAPLVMTYWMTYCMTYGTLVLVPLEV